YPPPLCSRFLFGLNTKRRLNPSGARPSSSSLVSVAKFVGLASIQARCADEIGTSYRYAPEFASTSRFVFDTGRHLPGAVVIVCMLSGAAFVPQRRDPRRD